MFLFSFAKVIPTFVNATEQDLATLKNYIETRATPVFGGEGWQYLGKGTSYAIMGNIPYPIKADVFTDTEITAETKELLDGGIILNFKMDELDFAASREQLKYTPKTKKNVSARLTDVTNDLMKQCSTSFDGCKTLWEAKLLYKKVFDFYGKLYKLRNLFRGSLKFNGFNINTESFSTRLSTGNDTDVTCMVYRAGKETLTKEHVYNIPADANIMVVENDGILNGVKNRLVEPLMRSVNKVDSIYLLSFTSDAVRTQWFTEVGLDCPITKLSTMTKHPMSSFYLSSSNYYGSRSTKHASKEFTFDGDGKTRYGNKRSDFWEEVEVDAAKDTGVYVALDAFHVDMPNTYNQFAFAHPSELSKLLKSFADAGIEVPDTIYGFKTSAVDKAMKNPNMQTLWVWLEKAVKDVITNDTVLAQKFINRNYVANTVYSLQTSLATMLSYIAKWGLPDTHPLMVLHVKMSELQNYRSAQMDKLNELLQKFNCVPKGAPTHDVKDEYEALAAKYPLLFQHVKDCSSASHLCYDHHQKLFKDYIDLVDLVTP
jgi:hypothetical protein